MRAEHIRCTPSWRGEGARRDCAFALKDKSQHGLPGMYVVRIKLFFSFKHRGDAYPCALVEWFTPVDDAPDTATGLWIVEPDLQSDNTRDVSVLHLDSLIRAAHLIPVFGQDPLPPQFRFEYSLDSFGAYYVNKFADHHSHELLSTT